MDQPRHRIMRVLRKDGIDMFSRFLIVALLRQICCKVDSGINKIGIVQDSLAVHCQGRTWLVLIPQEVTREIKFLGAIVLYKSGNIPYHRRTEEYVRCEVYLPRPLREGDREGASTCSPLLVY